MELRAAKDAKQVRPEMIIIPANFHLGFFDFEVSINDVATFACAFCPITASARKTTRPINKIANK